MSLFSSPSSSTPTLHLSVLLILVFIPIVAVPFVLAILLTVALLLRHLLREFEIPFQEAYNEDAAPPSSWPATGLLSR